MKALIVAANHLKGVSTKTGNPYDFHSLDLIVEQRVRGGSKLRAVQKTVNIDVLSLLPQVPALVELHCNMSGYIEDVECISIDVTSPEVEEFLNIGYTPGDTTG